MAVVLCVCLSLLFVGNLQVSLAEVAASTAKSGVRSNDLPFLNFSVIGDAIGVVGRYVIFVVIFASRAGLCDCVCMRMCMRVCM